MSAVLTRQEVLSRIREELLKLVDEEHSICQIAAQKGLFCRGFSRYTDEELRERYGWLLMRPRALPRPRLEELANTWQLARQVVHDVPIACDVQQLEHDTCGGWDDFANEDLARFYEDLVGGKVTIQQP